ncbi:peptidylprolyl isomerase [Candidatus Woesearchaeota archaeon]|nr:peptidylprolyl isomerase [Candidatus Woesearchaeota archaeon]
MTIKKGDKVKVEYTGTFDDGTVFDASEKHGKPLEFEVGAKQVIKGFDDAVVGMKKGEEKEIKLASKEAYGDPNPMLVKKVPREQLPKDQDPKPGMMLVIGTPDGKQIPARITDVTDKEITVDINHPLAGKNLNFKLKIADIS